MISIAREMGYAGSESDIWNQASEGTTVRKLKVIKQNFQSETFISLD